MIVNWIRPRFGGFIANVEHDGKTHILSFDHEPTESEIEAAMLEACKPVPLAPPEE